MSAGPPKFIYFDLGNVLLTFDHEIACRNMAAVSGAPVDRVRQVVFENSLEWDYERGDLTSRQFYDIFCRETGTQANFDDLMFAAADMFELNAPVVPIVGHLNAAGYRLGILSNTCDAHWRYVSDGRYNVVTEMYGVYALSFEINRMKPEPQIYAAAAELAGVAPQEIFFVDDRADNVAAAREAGYDAVQFQSALDLARSLRERNVKFNY